MEDGSDAMVATAVAEAMTMAFVLTYIVERATMSLRVSSDEVGNIEESMIVEHSEN